MVACLDEPVYPSKRVRDCRVCGAYASGLHYGVVSCEGCKVFFKRHMLKYEHGHCFYGGSCVIDLESRSRCRVCRFKKCLEQGMSIKAIRLGRKPSLSKKVPQKRKRRSTNSKHGRPLSPSSLKRVPSETASDIDVPCKADVHDVFGYCAAECSPTYNLVPFADEVYLCSGNAMQTPTKGGYYAASRRDSMEETLFPDEQLNRKTLAVNVIEKDTFVPFSVKSMGNYEANRSQIATTVFTVGAAAEIVFGDQISDWSSFRDRALKSELLTENSLDVSANQMLAAINWHCEDNVVRTQKFAALLPGMNELTFSARACPTEGWKWMVYALIHHAPFLTNVESYFTVGPKHLHYSRKYQELFSKSNVQLYLFIYRFCSLVRDIDLNQTERFLLMAIVMFESGEDQSLQLKLIHRHYVDALLDSVKRRCADALQLAGICRRLETFFTALKGVARLHAAI